MLGLALLFGALVEDAAIALYLVSAELLAIFGSACEHAFRTHSRAGTIEAAVRRGKEARVRAWLDTEGRYVLTARLVRFLGSALLVVGVAYLFLGDHIPGSGLPVGTLLLVVLITFGVTFLINDVIVRLLVRKDPDGFLVSAMPSLEFFRYALLPLRVPLVWIAHFAFRVRLEGAAPSTREEVLETVEEGEREGSLTKTEAEMIGSIMVLESRQAKDVMTPRADMVMFPSATTIPEAAETAVEGGLSRIPVYEKDRDDVIGVFYARDLLARLHRMGPADAYAGTVVDMMRDTPFFVPETKAAAALLAEMRLKQVHMAIVVDEFNGTSGLVTIEDLLEEIVGDIRDEYDAEEEPAQASTGGDAHEFEGRTPIEEVNQALDVELPVEDDFETMSGLLFHRLGGVPAVGDTLQVAGTLLTVLDADTRTVRRVQVHTNGDVTPA